jgi:hypothetical protein
MTMTAKTACEPFTRLNTLFDLSTPVLASPGLSGAILAGPEQLTTNADGPPDPRGAVWLAFTGDHDKGKAAVAFRRRYGQHPRYVFDGPGGLLLVGPVPGLEGMEVQL